MTFGTVLAARRGELGLTLEQVASVARIRRDRLEALERGDLASFAAPVYARGHARAYAEQLGLDPAVVTGLMPARLATAGLDIEGLLPPARDGRRTLFVALAAALLVAGAVSGYLGRQVLADPHPGAHVTSRAGADSMLATSLAPIVVKVHVSAAVWINASVDGRPAYGLSGATLPAGSNVTFTGTDVVITSGDAAVTFITVDGQEGGAMGTGVTTRDFRSQTSLPQKR